MDKLLEEERKRLIASWKEYNGEEEVSKFWLEKCLDGVLIN